MSTAAYNTPTNHLPTEIDKVISTGMMSSMMMNRTKLLIFAILSIMAMLCIRNSSNNSNSSSSSYSSKSIIIRSNNSSVEFLKETNYIGNNSIHDNMKFYSFPECSSILDKQRIGPSINMYRGFLNTSFITDDITLATYCLSASYCTRDEKLMKRMEKICPKILVVELDYNPKLLKDLLANSKVHYLLSNCRPQYFRPNHDICVPLSLKTPLKCDPNTDLARQYVASFVGTIYINSYGRHRYTLKWLNETSDIFIKFNCNQGTNIHRMKSHGSKYLRTACDRYESSLSPLDYCKSLNSTFILCPGGRQPASYRLLEALMVNAIPVPYYESFDSKIPMPFHRVVDWEQCTKVYTEIGDVERLIQSDEKAIARLLKGCSNVYKSHLSSFEMMIMTTNQELQVLASITKSQSWF